MKKLLLAMTLLIAGFAVQAQTENAADKTVKFKEMTWNFGKIKQGVPVTHDFVFTNSGSTPLVIENASASCGCTTPSWPQAPVMAGKADKIKAGFNAASVGPFEKSIFVKVKGMQQQVVLKIQGEVLNADAYAKYEAEQKGKKAGK